MLIRFILDNYLSFGDQSEFNLLSGRQTRLNHHQYKFNDVEILKMSAVYGANGAGKSNFIKGIKTLKEIVLSGTLPTGIFNSRFKLDKENKERGILLGVEFISQETPFLYAVEIDNGRIEKEELYISGLGQQENSIVFERTKDNEGINRVRFSKEFDKTDEGKLLRKLITKSYKKSNKPFIHILHELEHSLLDEINKAYHWFQNRLYIVQPDIQAAALVHKFKTDSDFQKFTTDLICSFQTGINNIQTESQNLKDFLGENETTDSQEIEEILKENPDQMVGLRSKNEEIIVTNEDNNILTHRLYFNHSGQDEDAKFYVNEESDGTQRLLDYIPAFKGIIENDNVFIIDEIERSIHPLIVKELLRKFSEQEDTKGQIVFTTHESNLLDQDIFRQDEIWFTEKDEFGKSHMYPLSDFKEHHTLDIQKGYLDGRYGAIPFLGNLRDLKWGETNASE